MCDLFRLKFTILILKGLTMKNKLIILLICSAVGAGLVYYRFSGTVAETEIKDDIQKIVDTKKLTEPTPAHNAIELDKQKGKTVKTTDSGIKYEIINEAAADAKKPEAGQMVTVHYTGWLNDNDQPGSKFDSSVDRGQPFQFNVGVGMVIRGWDESVLDMKVGEKRRVIIPAELGYGAHGAGAVIPPNADLMFDIELLEA
jgi:FKBP-type peptidyl-prolyl cis-trans isomerase